MSSNKGWQICWTIKLAILQRFDFMQTGLSKATRSAAAHVMFYGRIMYSCKPYLSYAPMKIIEFGLSTDSLECADLTR